jgi:hypothetical protein
MKVLALTCLLTVFAAILTFAQSPPVAAVSGGYLALSVPDLDASAKWYAETFDLTVVRSQSSSPDKKSVATILTGHGLIVELVQHNDAKPITQAAPGRTRAFEIHGIFKSGVVVPDLDATLKALEARNVDIAFRIFSDAALALRTFAIRDNAGNFIQFFGK